MTIRQILSNFFSLEKLDKAPREVFTPELQKDLLLLEEQEGSVNFKFGVIYAREGQTTDDEMLSNERGSPGFESFPEILGERIRLKGWDKYRGGLDVKGTLMTRNIGNANSQTRDLQSEKACNRHSPLQICYTGGI
ncbi:PREDICTED: GTPase-activating Rap/Ran-GAP domain-like protein 3 [Wasmannia auropunctata]|uniref:GTPase-activating Rap/Ran-GAP domain-like protein 3 n=1 Tax=Wasmannia auropunctata TaxID=64793 RepID=UPI0005EFF213|nr:PREDICTED: GTPase-activating Rap/Ran-GAP domain-like protein 3 [Wasmannia auropunctata]